MRSGGKGLAMISVINILMNLLQHETEKYIFIDTCKSQRHPPRIVYATKDHPCHARDIAMPDGGAFVFSLAQMAEKPCLKRHPPAGSRRYSTDPPSGTCGVGLGAGGGSNGTISVGGSVRRPCQKKSRKLSSRSSLTSDPFKTAVDKLCTCDK